MKKKLLPILLGIETVFLLLSVSLWIITYTTHTQKNEIDREASPNGEYTLVLYRIGEPDWPFGSDHLEVTLFKTGDSSNFGTTFQADVANDGANATYEVNWSETEVKITLLGSEQPNSVYCLPLEG